MIYILLHNPGCGSSKKGLALLQDNDIEVKVRKYASKTEQLDLEELKSLAQKMGGVSPRAFLREKDAEKTGLAETATDAQVFAAMAENPKLIQRPIGIKGDKAVLGRPNSALLDIV